MTQATLSFLTRAPKSLAERFEHFHATNPHVFAELRALALRAKASGIERWSVDALFHVLRWERAIATRSDDGFRLNNNYTSHYARRLMDEVPELAGFFNTRRSSAEGIA